MRSREADIHRRRTGIPSYGRACRLARCGVGSFHGARLMSKYDGPTGAGAWHGISQDLAVGRAAPIHPFTKPGCCDADGPARPQPAQEAKLGYSFQRIAIAGGTSCRPTRSRCERRQQSPSLDGRPGSRSGGFRNRPCAEVPVVCGISLLRRDGRQLTQSDMSCSDIAVDPRIPCRVTSCRQRAQLSPARQSKLPLKGSTSRRLHRSG